MHVLQVFYIALAVYLPSGHWTQTANHNKNKPNVSQYIINLPYIQYYTYNVMQLLKA